MFLPIFCFSQVTEKAEIYLDENLKPIDFTEFYRKNLSFLFFKTTSKKDLVTVNMLHNRYKLGEFSDAELTQIRLFLNANYKNQISENKNIIISFTDKLYGYQILKKLQDSIDIAHNHSGKNVLTSYRYDDSRIDFDKEQKKCKKKYKKHNIEPYYFYRKKLDFNFNYENISWKKLPRFFETLFFKQQHSSMVIIKPNGQYIYYHRIPEKFIKKLLKEDLTEVINNYETALSNLSIKPIGFFLDIANYSKNRNLSFQFGDTTNKTYSFGGGSSNRVIVRDREAMMEYLQDGFKCYSYGSY
jgi:hypothetical protein